MPYRLAVQGMVASNGGNCGIDGHCTRIAVANSFSNQDCKRNRLEARHGNSRLYFLANNLDRSLGFLSEGSSFLSVFP